MDNKIDLYCKELSEKRITVLGVGISNLPLINFLHNIGVKHIKAVDKGGNTENSYNEMLLKVQGLKEKGIIQDYKVGEDYLSEIWENTDVIFKTPVVRFDIPELCEARSRGVRITSEMEEFMNLCPAKMFAITGSDGKTTTTTLVYKILSEHYKNSDVKVWVGGNIGQPLFSFIREIKPSDKVVLELSSFQLMNAKVAPDVSVITNITPNHLDVHKDYQEYIDAKKEIFKNQTGEGLTVLNADNEITLSCVFETPARTSAFSYDNDVTSGVCIENGNIVYKKRGVSDVIVSVDSIILPGRHNVENYMAAILAVYEDINRDKEAILAVASSFGGVEHRLEFVRELDGVKYYNSSIDSSPNRTIKALSVFKKKNIVMIAGGKDKKIPYDEIGEPIAEKVKVLILTGPTAEKIEKAVNDYFTQKGSECDMKIIHCNTYEEAVLTAKNNACPGDVVLLSPASTSFDMFKNFEERGNIFKKLVNNLT